MQSQPVVSTRPSHSVSILMSAVGRFLVCRTCQLSFEFPSGETYLTVAKQFESQSCGRAAIPPKAQPKNDTRLSKRYRVPSVERRRERHASLLAGTR